MHGGGYVTGSINSHLMLCIPMAQTLKMNVLAPEYRLAPEHPFPAALEDALKAYRWLLTQGYKPADIIIAGDSAGGGLALATVLALRESRRAAPRGNHLHVALGRFDPPRPKSHHKSGRRSHAQDGCFERMGFVLHR